jgi:hypothetical protein
VVERRSTNNAPGGTAVKKRLIAALAIAAFASGTLAACGGDEDEGEPLPNAPEPQANDGDTAAATTVEISAAPDGSLAYEQGAVVSRAGDVYDQLHE